MGAWTDGRMDGWMDEVGECSNGDNDDDEDNLEKITMMRIVFVLFVLLTTIMNIIFFAVHPPLLRVLCCVGAACR